MKFGVSGGEGGGYVGGRKTMSGRTIGRKLSLDPSLFLAVAKINFGTHWFDLEKFKAVWRKRERGAVEDWVCGI